tara:strand:- start:12131 stop:13009 length:879 start_codon:yes stop_codon:yes gene_type:complete
MKYGGFATRKEFQDSQRAAKQKLKDSGTKKCLGCCKLLPIALFKSRDRMARGKLVHMVEARCHECLAKQVHERITSDEYKTRNRINMKTPERRKWRKQHRQQDHVKEQEESYRTSDPGRASLKKRKAKHYGSDRWRLTQDYVNECRRDAYASSSEIRLNVSLSNTVASMIKGNRQNSESLYSFTEFNDASDLKEHLEERLAPGMTMENYGTVWHVEHRIAKCWYANSKEDVRRCWSKANIVPEFAKVNLQKSVKIIDQFCHDVGPDKWPMAWNGSIPTEAERKEMYRRVLCL